MQVSILLCIAAIIANMVAPRVWAEGIVDRVISSPLAAAGTVQGGPTSINIYLQNAAVQGDAFHDPKIVGYGIPAGGRLEIELGEGFERIESIPLTQKAIMLVPAAQQPLPGKKVGYTIKEGQNPKTFVIAPVSNQGLPAASLMTPLPSVKADPIRARGIKIIHIGFLQYSFRNTGNSGKVAVRFIDGNNKVLHQGHGIIDFLASPVAQIYATNLSDKHRNHNWQRIKPDEVLGHTQGTLPLSLMLYTKVTVPSAKWGHFKQGIERAGVISPQQLQTMGYTLPASLARYSGGLIVKDTNSDGKLNPHTDSIIGGIIASAPEGATGQELQSWNRDGEVTLSRPTVAYSKKFGPIFGGSIMQVQFQAGDKPGLYQPTFALLRNSSDLASGDGSQLTYTIVVK